MEENFTETTHPLPEPEKGLVLSEEALYYLQTAAKWAKFLAILGFIGCVIMVLVGLFAGSIFSKMGTVSAYPSVMSQSAGAFMSVFYIAFALLYFFPSLYLYQFAKFAQNALLFSSSQDITLAMGKLKSFFKFVGILIIAILSLYLLIVIGVFVMMGTYSAFRQ
ncbi:DUF5362 domain-containing protein [Mucilaginibacter galii]|uniref:DUF5362 domain-containing protein n=1 Tax=Mucilaginibacter galii TaxID=2005073 RepID=A0A917J9E6_9SPHI|nr:DUF5362 family protein [Mucilaginibacter galii]GGI50340.1 hypothetical protein GCM10011425_15520 [Mucilaginibacter galii]